MVDEVGLIFPSTFVVFPTSLVKFPRGSPHRFSRPCDTAFDRSAPMSPDHILGLDATPVSLSETVLPDAIAGFLVKRFLLAKELFT